ncbi:uncharacterized protein EI90DRAFT_3256312 [Cantharellus anzutake]|uniref:uncharacterized protein n=1 Tax=Cantharellus anzutake TaxID=1750568 RepID=UPI001906A097|nr:uncharacterized protein EI90DRAFT_3256312 [Cantharellus anzutake]KAF8337592.1 hypothetical protein EI90DRAFT_3256312 [Cantharellus anzutake]
MSVVNIRTALSTVLVFAQFAITVNAHISVFHPAMWGFNTNADTPTPVGGDNRPVIPLMNRKFNDWWFHGLLNDPPAADAIVQMPVGQTTMLETVCDKGASSYWNSSAGHTFVQTGDDNYPCPGYPLSQFHTTGINDLGGCALSIAYKSDVNQVTPDDFVIFSVQHQCVWTRWTAFDVPADMPACPNGKCICAWHWASQCITGYVKALTDTLSQFRSTIQIRDLNRSKSGSHRDETPWETPGPRYCGADSAKNKPAVPSNCTYGAKSPMWWFQAEGNNMFEDAMDAPTYNDRYHFSQGAQVDIFGDVPATSYSSSTSFTPTPTTTSTSTSTSTTTTTTTTTSSASSSPQQLYNNAPSTSSTSSTTTTTITSQHKAAPNSTPSPKTTTTTPKMKAKPKPTTTTTCTEKPHPIPHTTSKHKHHPIPHTTSKHKPHHVPTPSQKHCKHKRTKDLLAERRSDAAAHRKLVHKRGHHGEGNTF